VGLIQEIGDLFNDILGLQNIFVKTFTDGEILVENIRAEARKLKAFKSDPKWKTRVIVVPRAIEQTHDLITSVTDEIATAFHDFGNNVKNLFHDPLGTPKEPGQKGAEIAGVLTKVQGAIRELDGLFIALGGLVSALRKVRDELETFDSLFLPQGSTKTTVDVKYRKRNAQ
jgi:hypothetical protein